MRLRANCGTALTRPANPKRRDDGGDLARRLRRGEAGALADAYRIHHAAVRAFARRLTGEAALADDLVQEAFLALPAALARYREEASLATFLMAIAAKRARRHLRSAARRRAALSRLASQPAGTPPGPDVLAGWRELAAALRRGLDSLPPAQRDAILLCAVEQLSSREAAAVAGSPEETLRTRLFHARRKLRTFLEREGLVGGLRRDDDGPGVGAGA
jgi:RNA polymerase sigma-70 factor, ECF subfamily